MVAQRGLQGRIEVDSCGTGDWHIGGSPDPRAAAEAKGRGYDLDHLRARQVVPQDFEHFDYILAMDRQNLADLHAMSPQDYAGCLDLFLNYASDTDLMEVPDPYYGGDQGFALVLDLIESASEGLLRDMGFEHTA